VAKANFSGSQLQRAGSESGSLLSFGSLLSRLSFEAKLGGPCGASLAPSASFPKPSQVSHLMARPVLGGASLRRRSASRGPALQGRDPAPEEGPDVEPMALGRSPRSRELLKLGARKSASRAPVEAAPVGLFGKGTNEAAVVLQGEASALL